MSTPDHPAPPGWVTLADGIQFSHRWLAAHTPDLYAAWTRAAGARERRSVAGRILQAAADLESEDDPADPGVAVWADLADRLDPQLTAGPDWLSLAAALTRADAAGYDVLARLPALAGAAPLPARHPARELHFRLLSDCVQAAAASSALDRSDPPCPAAAGRHL